MEKEKYSLGKPEMLNTQRTRISAVLTLILSCFVLYASFLGVMDKNLYKDVHLAGTIPENLITGSMAQDIVFIPLSIAAIILAAVFLLRPGYKSFISLIGLAWCFFYGYGLYVIQGQYTSIYLVYMAIFGLSLYSMIFGLLSFNQEAVIKTVLPKSLRILISIYFIITLFVLVPGWLIRITPDIARHAPASTYGVFILDLCMVFPAFGIITYQLLKSKAYGNIFSGIALLKALTLCLSWAFGELSNPFFGNPLNTEMAVISSCLTIFALLLFIPYLMKIRLEE